MNDTPTSGNRWEPTTPLPPMPAAPPQHQQAPYAAPAYPTPAYPTGAYAAPATRPRVAHHELRTAALSAAAAALVVLVAVGGFVVGRATAPDSTGPTNQQIQPNNQQGPNGFPGFNNGGQGSQGQGS